MKISLMIKIQIGLVKIIKNNLLIYFISFILTLFIQK